jgi:hypothetical protein
MNEIEELLKVWEDGNYINPDALKAAHAAIKLLVIKIQELEAQIKE